MFQPSWRIKSLGAESSIKRYAQPDIIVNHLEMCG